MKGQLVLLVCLLPFIGMGQKVEGPTYVLNNFTGQGVLLRWASPELYFNGGVNIYRKEEGEIDWQKITSEPVYPPQVRPNNITVSEDSKDFLEYYKNASKEEFLGDMYGILGIVQSIKDFQFALAMGVAYHDNTAVKGRTYTYKINAIKNGKEELVGITESIVVQNYTNDHTPKSITVERKKEKMRLKWEYDVDHQYGIFIYRKQGDEDFELITKTEIGTGNIKPNAKYYFEDKNVSDDSVYTYKLQAMNYFGQLSEFSEEIVMEVVDLDPPQAPEIQLKALSKEQEVIVSWGNPLDTDLKGYNVLRKGTSDSTFTKVNQVLVPPTDTSFIDITGESTVFAYIVQAVDQGGNMTPSSERNVRVYDLSAPMPPTGLTVSADTGVMIMNWEPNTEEDLLGYRVMRSTEGGTPMIVNKEILDTNYYEQKLAKNVSAKFTYYVVAVDASFNFSKPSGDASGKLPDVTPPKAPFVKEAVVKDSVIDVNWSPSLSKDLMGYDIYRKVVGDSTSQYEKYNAMLIPSSAHTYVDNWVERGVNYSYQLVALDSSELSSEVSNSVSGKLPLLPLTGEIVIIKDQFNKAKKSLNLKWESNLKHEPLAGYIVYCSINGGKVLPVGGISKKEELKLKLSNEGEYNYHIRAFGERGNYVQSNLININVTP